eukprot:gene5133-254_t
MGDDSTKIACNVSNDAIASAQGITFDGPLNITSTEGFVNNAPSQFIVIQRQPTSTADPQMAQTTVARLPVQCKATVVTSLSSTASTQEAVKSQSLSLTQQPGVRKIVSTNRSILTFNRQNLIPVQVSQGHAYILNSVPQTATAKPQILPKGSSPEKLSSQPGPAQVYLPLSFASTNQTITVRPIAPRGAVNVTRANEIDKKKQPQLVPKIVSTQPRQILLPSGSIGQAGTVTFSGQNSINTSNIQSLSNNVLRMPSGELMQAVITPVQYRGALPPGALIVGSNTKNSQEGEDPLNSDEVRVETKPVKKPCNCTKSQCLKLYCDCFANGEFCSNCNCQNCENNIEHEVERSKAIKACLERNPQAFHPKIGKTRGVSERRHTKGNSTFMEVSFSSPEFSFGCHCKRSGCLKNYCECYEAKIMCSTLCKCTGCKNFEESPERKTLMHLADAAEVRVLQQNAARSKLESQLESATTKPLSTNTERRLPFTFITTSVANATCECLLECAEKAETIVRALNLLNQ